MYSVYFGMFDDLMEHQINVRWGATRGGSRLRWGRAERSLVGADFAAAHTAPPKNLDDYPNNLLSQYAQYDWFQDIRRKGFVCYAAPIIFI